jgi:hypothetical protein
VRRWCFTHSDLGFQPAHVCHTLRRYFCIHRQAQDATLSLSGSIDTWGSTISSVNTVHPSPCHKPTQGMSRDPQCMFPETPQVFTKPHGGYLPPLGPRLETCNKYYYVDYVIVDACQRASSPEQGSEMGPPFSSRAQVPDWVMRVAAVAKYRSLTAMGQYLTNVCECAYPHMHVRVRACIRVHACMLDYSACECSAIAQS